MCRKDIIDLLHSLKSPKSRLTFCRMLPQIIVNAYRQEWKAMNKKADEFLDVTDQFYDYLLRFYCHIQRGKIMFSYDEHQLIAEAIQQDKIEMPIIPQTQRPVCSDCFKPLVGSVRRQETCRDCTAKKPKSKRKTLNTKTSMNCQTCETSTNEHRITCVKCSKSFHSTASCIPAGALLLTQSQFICPCCSVLKENKATKGWPALIVPKEQVPQNIYNKNLIIGYDAVFVFLIGENKYQQVKLIDFMSRRIAKSSPYGLKLDRAGDVADSLRENIERS